MKYKKEISAIVSFILLLAAAGVIEGSMWWLSPICITGMVIAAYAGGLLEV